MAVNVGTESNDKNLQAKKNATATVQPKAKTAAHDGAASWTTEEIQLLVKAANLYPPGTVERWKQVAQYIADHCSTPAGKLKNEKDIIKQVPIDEGVC